ncbi:MAG: PAC2 family protein [bacterium]|nr:PAC2 family protein [bacterium]
MDDVEFHREPPANLTTMVIGFGGWIDAGEAATGSIRYMVRRLSAPRLASIDPEAFFEFTEVRPFVRRTADGNRTIRWPRSDFFMWQPPDGQEGLLLFRGMEPNLRWQTYSKLLLDFAEQCGVKRIVSVGALIAAIPHTRPPRVTGRSTEPEWRALLEDWDIFREPSYQGPTGIATVVLDAATRRSMPHLSFMGQSPHYIQAVTNPAVTRALLTYVTRLLGIELDLSPLDKAVDAFCTRCDQAVANDPSTQASIRQLEQEYDSTVDKEPLPLLDEDTNPDELVQELEDFLRDEREGRGET